MLEQRFVEPARRAVVDVLDGGLAVTQSGGAQSGLEAPGAAIGSLAVEQQRQPFGVRQIAGLLLRSSSMKAWTMPSSLSALS